MIGTERKTNGHLVQDERTFYSRRTDILPETNVCFDGHVSTFEKAGKHPSIPKDQEDFATGKANVKTSLRHPFSEEFSYFRDIFSYS